MLCRLNMLGLQQQSRQTGCPILDGRRRERAMYVTMRVLLKSVESKSLLIKLRYDEPTQITRQYSGYYFHYFYSQFTSMCVCVHIPSLSLWDVCVGSPGTVYWALWCHAERPGLVSDLLVWVQVQLSPFAATMPASLLWPNPQNKSHCEL